MWMKLQLPDLSAVGATDTILISGLKCFSLNLKVSPQRNKSCFCSWESGRSFTLVWVPLLKLHQNCPGTLCSESLRGPRLA